MKRLLVPVASAHSARRVVDYLVRRSCQDKDLLACLLHVEEPITQCSELMDRYAPRYRIEPSDLIFNEPLGVLERNGIEHCAYVRSGGIVLTILDTAEELECHEIVLPPPARGIQHLWSRNIVWHVMSKQGKVPVVLIA